MHNDVHDHPHPHDKPPHEHACMHKGGCKHCCGKHKRKMHGCGGHTIGGTLWFIGWLFTIGYLHLSFWYGVLALIVWPYFLGTHFAL